ncbi:MAG: leucine-rich repeat domain-containing protein [Prevotella sp.]|nr:leucine-rich repeat domain-containing protein [Prevotella sp.]MBR3480701.1 leucine-rich repeat domain-containing protein [Prevotella sp.]
MNKKSLLTWAFITLARSVRARQAIAAVLMLFAAPTAWASEPLKTFNYSVGYTGSITKDAFIKNIDTDNITDFWEHGINTLWPGFETHRLDMRMEVTPLLDLDATQDHFRTSNTNYFYFVNGGEGRILDAKLSYGGNAIVPINTYLKAIECDVEVAGDTHFDGFTVVWVDKDVSTISLPEGVTLTASPYCTYNGTDYYVVGDTYTISIDADDKAFSDIEFRGAYNIKIAADKRSASFKVAADVTVSATFQTISGTCGDNATWALSQDAAGNYTCLTISGSGAIYDYNHTTDGSTTTWRTTAPWGWDLTSITIGDEITSIGDYAFIGCQHLSKLSLGNGVKSIGTNAFDHCDGLTWVSLPSSVSTLAAGAFKNSVNLQTVYIQKSDGLVSITGVSAFDGCHSSLVIDVPTPALALQYKTASYWSNYAERLRVGFGNYLFSATDEGGTPAYAISNADDLRNLSAAVNMTQGYASTGKTFRQTADIALSGNFAPIANYNGYNFAGTYDGGGHVISGLSISGNDANNAYNGLFGVVSGGTVSNVILMNPSVTATGSYTGALIGRIDNQGSAINCYAYGTDNLIGSTGKATVTNVARARKVTFNDGITVTPDASDIANGFVYSDESYYREGLELSLNVERPGYDAHYSYTDGTTTTKFEVATLTVPAADITVSATFTVKKWAGTGTVDDPYVVEYVSQLNALADSVNSGISYADIYFKLGADISYDTNGLSDTESNFTAIGGYKHPFNGHFDGAKHVISGIRIYKGGSSFEDYYQGLFGLLGAGASVSYVLLSDSRITGYQHVGGIVGNNSGGTVTNCFVLKDVTINAVKSMSLYHGGNVGSNMNGGTVTNCAGAATVTYADGINYCQCYGGIVGENENASIEYCLYTGNTVKGNSYVGAIIGNNCGSSSKVEHCYYTNNSITGKDSDGNELANADCAVGENSDKSPNPENIGQVDYHGLAPKPLFSQMAPQDDEDNSVFVALMARRAAALKAAVPQYDASVTLTLRGRTLNRDGKWHTICLPFDVDLTKAEGVLYGAEARELTNASITGTTLHLEFSNPVEKLIAGTPYIIRLGNTVSAARAESSTLTDPIFANVDVDDTDRSFDNTESGNQRVRFVGSYKMTNFDNTLKSTLLVNGTDSPYYPTTGTNIGAFRAYFTIGDGDNQGTVSITDFDIKLGDDEYTGIVGNAAERCTERQSRKVILNPGDGNGSVGDFADEDVRAPKEWYDLNGRKLSGKPSRSGLYIQK